MAIIAKAQITTALELMTYEDALLSNVFALSSTTCFGLLQSLIVKSFDSEPFQL